MKSLDLGRYASYACVVAALLAGCDGSHLPVAASGTMPQARSRSTPAYQVLYRFGDHANPAHDLGGANPEGLLAVGDELYGTTGQGGNDSLGTVYSLSTAGVKKVLHRFGTGPSSSSDGVFPVGTLIKVKSLLYGATLIGGGCGSGSVYSISTSGTETILHSFCGASEGIQPLAGLVNVNGTLYGTTQYGESTGNGGTVYSVTTGGAYKTVHNFTNSPNDGAEPAAPLLNVNGTLYGTTAYGGSGGFGTVYTIDAKGNEKVLYSFQGGYDAARPFSGLINVNGTLYGTTLEGGTGRVGCSPSYAGCGTVYSISTKGREKVLYSFGGFGTFGGDNGASPWAGVLEFNGVLYGTTSVGGTNGLGVIFSLTPSGSETVLHDFAGGTDGSQPFSELIDVNGTLYGTTSQGGSTSGCKRFGGSGCGTVFTLTP